MRLHVSHHADIRNDACHKTTHPKACSACIHVLKHVMDVGKVGNGMLTRRSFVTCPRTSTDYNEQRQIKQISEATAASSNVLGNEHHLGFGFAEGNVHSCGVELAP